MGKISEIYYEEIDPKICTTIEAAEFYYLFNMLDIDEEATLITEDISQLLYLGKNIRINLVGNFEKDIYYIIISEEERKNNER